MIEPTYIESTASFDDERIYRYNLLRRWAPGPTVLWLMLNPSTADAVKLDPTLQRCLGFTMRWRYFEHAQETGAVMADVEFGAFEVCNLYAFRSSDPKDLWKTADPVGPNNDAAIAAAAKRAELVIVGWGDNARPERERQVAQLLADLGVQPYALRLCDSGSPSHPLARGKFRIPDDVNPFRWHAKGLR